MGSELRYFGKLGTLFRSAKNAINEAEWRTSLNESGRRRDGEYAPRPNALVYYGVYFVTFLMALFLLAARQEGKIETGKVLLLLCFLGWELNVLLYSASIYIWLRKKDRPPIGRPTAWELLKRNFAIIPLGILLLIAGPSIWTWADVGFKGWIAGFSGVLAAVILESDKFGHNYQDKPPITQHMLACFRAHLPRGGFAQCVASLNTAVVSPICEELVYRDFFVFFLGSLIGHLWAVAIGLVLCLWLHIYQGLEYVVQHVKFYAVACFLLYSPAGIVGVILFHVTANSIFLIGLRRWTRAFTQFRGVKLFGRNEKT